MNNHRHEYVAHILYCWSSLCMTFQKCLKIAVVTIKKKSLHAFRLNFGHVRFYGFRLKGKSAIRLITILIHSQKSIINFFSFERLEILVWNVYYSVLTTSIPIYLPFSICFVRTSVSSSRFCSLDQLFM